MWKYLRTPFWQRIFWKKIFFLFKMVYQDIVKAFFKRKAPEVNANFYVFESQCPKIMVLSKALKAKLLSIPSKVASLSMLGLDQLSEKTTAVVPLFNHQPWRQLPHASPRWRALSMCMHVCFVRSFRCSLSLGGERQVYLWHFGRNLGQILRYFQR